LQSVGIQETVMVTGYQRKLVRRVLSSEPSLLLKLSFVENREFDKKNGVSLLAAAPFVDRECVLSMSDHLYSPKLVRRLLAAELPPGSSALGVDYDIERCFDLEDATKVRVDRGRIARIGKELEQYDAIDTGVFRIGPELIDELELARRRSDDCSLS